MTAAYQISAARALVAPLKDFTPGPWVFSERNTPGHFWIEPEVGYLPMPHYLSVSGPISRENAALIAAAPTLRDTVADLADLADAQAQEIERLQRHRVPAEWYADANERRNETEAERDRLRGCFKQIEAAALHGCLTPDLVAQIACAALGDAS